MPDLPGDNNENFMLIYVIVNCGLGSKVLRLARKAGIKGGTVVIAKGTARDNISRFLGLDETRRELVYLVAARSAAEEVMIRFREEMRFERPGHGIAFTIPVCNALGSSNLKCTEICQNREVSEVMHKLITVIVDKGRSETAMEAALKAGAKGGTILNARGAGIHETSRLFAMDIEPEKEILYIITETGSADTIIEAVFRELRMDEPGNGILFVQNVANVYGIAK